MEEVIDQFNSDNKYQYKFKTRVVIIWTIVLLLAILFEVRSWGGRTLMWLLSTGGFMAYAISGMITLRGKNILNTVLFIAGIIWTLYLLWGMLFNEGYPYNSKGVIVYLCIVAVYLGAYELAKFIRKKNGYKNP